jgi:biotin transporter BioY
VFFALVALVTVVPAVVILLPTVVSKAVQTSLRRSAYILRSCLVARAVTFASHTLFLAVLTAEVPVFAVSKEAAAASYKALTGSSY